MENTVNEVKPPEKIPIHDIFPEKDVDFHAISDSSPSIKNGVIDILVSPRRVCEDEFRSPQFFFKLSKFCQTGVSICQFFVNYVQCQSWFVFDHRPTRHA